MDLWGLGCCLAELISSTVDYQSFEVDREDMIIFKGGACYPLSPAEDQQVEDDGD